MNDDTVPDVGMTIGSGGAKIPSKSWGKCLSAAFNSCGELVSVTIPEGVETIEAEAFRACAKLSSISIPDSVTSVKVDAFLGCSFALCDQAVKKN